MERLPQQLTLIKMNTDNNLIEPQIFELDASDKSLMIDNDYFYYASAKKFKDVTEFRMAAQEGDSVFNLVKKIPLKDLVKLNYEKEDAQILLNLFYYNTKNKEEEISLLFENHFAFSDFTETVTSKLKLKLRENTQSTWKAISLNLFFTVLSIALTWLWFTGSLADSNGEHVAIGRGKGAIVQGLGIFLGRKITPWGVLGLGTLLSILAIYFLIKKYRNPPVDINLEKN
jgi:hypothetical protein